MDYWNNIIPLEDRALIKVTQNFCKDRSFKEAVLGLGPADPQSEAYYMTDEERQELRQHTYSSTAESYEIFITTRYFRYQRSLYEWERVMEENIQTILKNTKELPKYFHDEIKEWIRRHIFEFLSYCRRLQLVTGLSRYFFVDFITADDWNSEGRLDEKVLAERLISDERLTAIQRYRIACLYCLSSLRCRLWWRLSPEERKSLNDNDDPLSTFEYNRSVLFWSYYMKGGSHYKVNGETNPWIGAAEIAVYDGNVFALAESWKHLQAERKGTEACDMTFRCFNQWKICKAGDWKRKLLALDCYSSPWSFSDFCLPTHYARMISFLFKNMDQDELEVFFEELLIKRKDWDAMIYFLDWPNLDYFLPTIRSLRSFMSEEDLKMVYLESLFNLTLRHLAQHNRKRYPNEIRIDGLYDYRRVLRQLWDETPEKYKRYAFKDITEPNISHQYSFLMMLLLRKPFLKEDEWLLQRVFSNATINEKKVFLMSTEWRQIYISLVLGENWSLLDWFTKSSFDEVENELFRRWYIISSFGTGFCFDLLMKNKETILNDLICWSLKSDVERSQTKRNLLNRIPHIDECLSLISKGNFSEVERILSFCLQPKEIKKFKEKLANDDAFYSLIINHEWELLDKYVTWCFESEELIRKFKKDYFSSDGVDICFHYVFQENLKDIAKVFEYFCLSVEEIEKLKRDTFFSFQCIENIIDLLYNFEPFPIIPLLWCIQEEKMIFDLKITLEKALSKDSNATDFAKYRLQSLIELLLTLKRRNPNDVDISEELIEFL